MQGRVVPKIIKEEQGASEEKGEYARLSAFIGAIAIADLVKSTLGPKGMHKILQPVGGDRRGPPSKVNVTNDGATILKSINVDNAAAKVVVDASKTQDSEVGDGTTSVAVLIGELLRKAEQLVSQKMHPQTIVRGWRRAVVAARDALAASAVDNRGDSVKFREDLVNIGMTTLSSKILSVDKRYFSELAVNAVLRLKGNTDLRNIQIIKKTGGSLRDSYLDEGFILDKQIGVGQPKRMEKPRILVANTSMDTDKIKIFGARVRVDSMAKVAEIEKAEKQRMKEKVDKILKHKCNVFINRQLIYNYPEQLFTETGVMAIEHADFEGIERLVACLGGEIVSTFEHPELVQMGTCDLIEEVMIGEDKVIRFSGLPKGEACTIVLRGASSHILDEAERSMHDALCVLMTTVKDSKTVLGGGCAEMLMAEAVDRVAKTTSGKEAFAIEAFAEALRAIPVILADNGGFDSVDLVARLRAAHHTGQSDMGLDLDKGDVASMRNLCVTENFRVKNHVLVSAHEAAEVIVRVDEIIRQAPRKRTR